MSAGTHHRVKPIPEMETSLATGYAMRGREIDRLQRILSDAVDWLDGDDSEPWMVEARSYVALVDGAAS